MTTIQHKTCWLGRHPVKLDPCRLLRNWGWVCTCRLTDVKSVTGGRVKANIKLAVATEFLKIGTWNVQTRKMPRENEASMQ